MKVRTGFVSNSSSSSFVFAVRKTTHDAVMLELKEEYKKIIEKTVYFKNALGLELAVRDEFNDCGGNVRYSGSLERDEDDYDIEIEDEDGDIYEEPIIYIAIEKYEELCREKEPDYFTACPSDGG